MVRERRVELPRVLPRQILSLVRLPFRHSRLNRLFVDEFVNFLGRWPKDAAKFIECGVQNLMDTTLNSLTNGSQSETLDHRSRELDFLPILTFGLPTNFARAAPVRVDDHASVFDPNCTELIRM